MISGRKELRKARRVVVKVGTKSLTDNSKLDESKVRKLVSDVMVLRKQGRDVLVVTSGAVGAGVGRMGLAKRPKQLPLLQAAAAVGQGLLMQTYEKHFSRWKQPTAQMLLSAEDFTDPARYGNFKNTLSTLLKWGVVPIINENDTVAVEEIKLGDNDILSAYVAKGAKADLLLILSDVDGLYSGAPGDGKSHIIPLVRRVTPKIERAVIKSSGGFGGMFTKVQAARMASEAGTAVVIANAAARNVLGRIIKGQEVGTMFLPRVD
ncbi:MAG: glutamate 5-kinase [Candidatus Hadarchaeota archaeon]